MSRDGTGTYSLPQVAFISGTTIQSAPMNSNFTDIAAALTASIAKDGQTTPSADLPMGNFKHTSVQNAAARTQYASAAQVQDGAVIWGGTTGGTTSAYTATVSPGGVALVSGLTVRVKLHATNVNNATFSLNGLTAKSIGYFNKMTGVFTTLLDNQLYINQTIELIYESGQDKWMLNSPLADPNTWYAFGESVSGVAQAVVDFALPSGAVRIKAEISDFAPAVAAVAYARYSRDNGATYLSAAATYAWNQGAGGTADTVINLTGLNVAQYVFGTVEFQTNNLAFGNSRLSGILSGPVFTETFTMWGFNATGTAVTNIRFGFAGQNVASHRIRVFAQR